MPCPCSSPAPSAGATPTGGRTGATARLGCVFFPFPPPSISKPPHRGSHPFASQYSYADDAHGSTARGDGREDGRARRRGPGPERLGRGHERAESVAGERDYHPDFEKPRRCVPPCQVSLQVVAAAAAALYEWSAVSVVTIDCYYYSTCMTDTDRAKTCRSLLRTVHVYP